MSVSSESSQPSVMSTDQCALNLDGSLKDASEIPWFNDPDDEIPVASGSTLTGLIHTLTFYGLISNLLCRSWSTQSQQIADG